jgi:hypothetical protein
VKISRRVDLGAENQMNEMLTIAPRIFRFTTSAIRSLKYYAYVNIHDKTASLGCIQSL